MPLLKIKALNETTQLYVWKITETFDELFNSVTLKDISLARVESMKAESHQKGFLSVRRLLMEAGYTDFDLYYDEFGKPHLREAGRDFHLSSSIPRHISISHSHDFSAIAISDKSIGIDLEIRKDKIVKMAARFMDIAHLENLSHEEQIQKATVVWGIKESVFKIKNEIGISFKDNIFESDFMLTEKKCTAKLRFNNRLEHFDILFDFIEDYVFVCALEKKQ